MLIFVEKKYTCCGGEKNSSPCATNEKHVYRLKEENSITKISGDQAIAPNDISKHFSFYEEYKTMNIPTGDADFASSAFLKQFPSCTILSIDCEMVFPIDSIILCF